MSKLKKVGVIAGGGRLPLLLIKSLQEQNIPFSLVALEGYADLESLSAYLPKVFRLGKVGALLAYLKQTGCSELVMIGPVKRPSLLSLCPDFGALRFLWQIGECFTKGDDTLLKTIVTLLEKEGFKVRGADDYLPACIGKEGLNRALSEKEKRDLKIAWDFLTVTAPFDMGQGCVVQNGRILAVEGPEGTDNMLRRIKPLGILRFKRSGLLLKKPKVNQEMRVDMPMIGLETLKLAAEGGLAGVAYEAGSTFVIDDSSCQKMAAELGLFFGGIKIMPNKKIEN